MREGTGGGEWEQGGHRIKSLADPRKLSEFRAVGAKRRQLERAGQGTVITRHTSLSKK